MQLSDVEDQIIVWFLSKSTNFECVFYVQHCARYWGARQERYNLYPQEAYHPVDEAYTGQN